VILPTEGSSKPPAYSVTVIQPDIGLKNLFEKTHKMLYDLFNEGVNVLYRRIQSDIDLKVHIAKHTDCGVILSMKEHVEPCERYIGNYNTVLITTLPQEVDNVYCIFLMLISVNATLREAI
jgi:hypothetical protein